MDMTSELLECEELKRRLKIEERPCLPCKSDLLPSYYIERKVPKGCLAAHIGLCLLELKSIETIDKIIDQSLIVDAILLHDIGKLTKGYHKAPASYRHNVYSSLFILELRGLEEHKYELAMSVFLHHEYNEWERAYKSGEMDVLSTIPYRTTEMDRKRVEAFVDCMKSISERLMMRIDNTLNLLKNNADLVLSEPRRRLKGFRVANISTISEAIALSYILYLLDNRAALFREVRFEWLKNEVVKLKWRPEKLAEEILTNENIDIKRRARYVLLSLLPDYLKP